jgi:GxxExxY protein
VINEEYEYSELSSTIIGCAMTVHSESSNGFQEVIYQRALEFEMSSQGIDFSREQEMPVYYKNNQIGMRRVDFLIHGIIAIELKAINYLEASDLDSNKKNQNNPGIK